MVAISMAECHTMASGSVIKWQEKYVKARNFVYVLHKEVAKCVEKMAENLQQLIQFGCQQL